MAREFFDEPAEQSVIKSEIVVAYFTAWAQIIAKRAVRIGYFDLYSGPGRYGKGQKSTPLLLLETAVKNPKIASRLVSVFNDKNPDYTQSLQAEIDRLPGVNALKHNPQVITGDVQELVERFAEIRTIPAISFIDPWGYKGLSMDLIHAMIKDWACEVVFFFNDNRINMGINNPRVRHRMEALFGSVRLASLRKNVAGMRPRQREVAVHRAIEDALHEMGASYLVSFRFRRADGRLSHSINFVSKHELGYGIMKEIMAKRGLVDQDGVSRFEHIQRSAGIQLLLDYERPLDRLMDDLQVRFAGQSLSVKALFDKHNVGTDFIMPNYKEAIRRLEAQRKVTCSRDAEHRPKGSLADHIIVSFPPLP